MSIAARIEAPPASPDEPPEPALGRLATAAAWYSRSQPGVAPARPLVLVGGVSSPQTRALGERLGIELNTVQIRSDDPMGSGCEQAERAAASGTDVIVLAMPELAGTRHLVTTLAVISLLTDTEPVLVVPSASAVGPAAWAEVVGQVRDRRRQVARYRDEPGEMVTVLNVPELSAAVGVIMEAAARRVPLILDGLGAQAAGLVASSLTWSMKGWLAVADMSSRPAARAVHDYLRVDPLLANGVDTDDGAAGLLAVQALRDAATLGV